MPRHVKLNGGKVDSAKVLEAAKSPFSHAELGSGKRCRQREKPFPVGRPEICAAEPAQDRRLSHSAPSNRGLRRSFLESHRGIADQRLRPKTDAENKTECDIEKS